jgi:hypothetical protein
MMKKIASDIIAPPPSQPPSVVLNHLDVFVNLILFLRMVCGQLSSNTAGHQIIRPYLMLSFGMPQ